MSDRSSAAYKAWETRRANGWVHPSAIVIPVAPTKSKTAPVAKLKAKSKPAPIAKLKAKSKPAPVAKPKAKSKPAPVAKPKAKAKLVQLSAAEKAWITRRANGWVHPKSRPQPKRGKSKRG